MLTEREIIEKTRLTDEKRQTRKFDLDDAWNSIRRHSYKGVISFKPPTVYELNKTRFNRRLSQQQRDSGFKEVARSEFDDTVEQYVGVPILFNHLDNEGSPLPDFIQSLTINKDTKRMPLGVITKGWVEHGSMWIEFRPFSNILGLIMVWMVEYANIVGLSLQHIHNRIDVQAREVSLCFIGKRRKTSVRKVVEHPQDLPPLEFICAPYYHPPLPELNLEKLNTLFFSIAKSSIMAETPAKTTDTTPAAAATEQKKDVVALPKTDAEQQEEAQRGFIGMRNELITMEASATSNPVKEQYRVLRKAFDESGVITNSASVTEDVTKKILDVLNGNQANPLAAQIFPHFVELAAINRTTEHEKNMFAEKEKKTDAENQAACAVLLDEMGAFMAMHAGEPAAPVFEKSSLSFINKKDLLRVFSPYVAKIKAAESLKVNEKAAVAPPPKFVLDNKLSSSLVSEKASSGSALGTDAAKARVSNAQKADPTFTLPSDGNLKKFLKRKLES